MWNHQFNANLEPVVQWSRGSAESWDLAIEMPLSPPTLSPPTRKISKYFNNVPIFSFCGIGILPIFQCFEINLHVRTFRKTRAWPKFETSYFQHVTECLPRNVQVAGGGLYNLKRWPDYITRVPGLQTPAAVVCMFRLLCKQRAHKAYLTPPPPRPVASPLASHSANAPALRFYISHAQHSREGHQERIIFLMSSAICFMESDNSTFVVE